MPEEKKKLAPIASGSVEKRSGISKFLSEFFAADAPTIGRHLVNDVLRPAALRLLDDTITTAKDVALYGDNAAPAQKNKKEIVGTKVSYDKVSEKKKLEVVDTKRFDYPVVATKKDADTVLQTLNDVIEQYDMVTVADMYDLCGIKDYPFTANSYGWNTLNDAIVVHTSDGWLIKPSNPRPIDIL